jgi:hypothetical protein
LWIISTRMAQGPTYFAFCLSIAAGFLTVPLAFRLAYLCFKGWSANVPSFIALDGAPGPDGLASFLAAELSRFRGPRIAFVLSAAFAAMAFPVFWFAKYPVGFHSVPEIFAGILVACSAFIAGLGLVTILYGCRTIWRLGAFRVRVKSNKFGILSTGVMLSQCYLAIAVSWAVHSSSAIAGVDRSHLLDAQWPLVMLSVPTFVAFSASFIACQFKPHLRMLEFKKKELEEVEGFLDQLKPTRIEDLDSARKEKINYYEAKRNEIAALPEWPFSSMALLRAVGSSVTAVIPALTALSGMAKAAGILR